GLRGHIAIAHTRTAAMVLAFASPGLRVVDGGDEAAALAPIPVGILEKIDHEAGTRSSLNDVSNETAARSAFPLRDHLVAVLKSWGVRTLGEFAALPS